MNSWFLLKFWLKFDQNPANHVKEITGTTTAEDV